MAPSAFSLADVWPLGSSACSGSRDEKLLVSIFMAKTRHLEEVADSSGI